MLAGLYLKNGSFRLHPGEELLKRILFGIAICGLIVVTTAPASAQTPAVDDPVLKQIWTEAMENSQLEAGPYLAKWLALVPTEVSRHIDLQLPGMPSGGGSDHAAFVAVGAPCFSLSSLRWEYGYTWHTQRDTYDKIVFDEVRNNVVLAASLAYLASEE